MNCFVCIEEYIEFEKVKYYQVIIEKPDGTHQKITDDFFEWQLTNPYYYEQANDLSAWIAEIGDNRGAKIDFFRPEQGATKALPPPTRIIMKNEGKLGNNIDLRLYCIRLSESVVILCNGGVKTSQKNKNSTNINDKFELACEINKAISQLKNQNRILVTSKNLSVLGKIPISIEESLLH